MEYIFSKERTDKLNRLLKLRDCIDADIKDGQLIYGFKYKRFAIENKITPEEVAAYEIYNNKLLSDKKIEDKSKWIVIRGVTFKNPKVDIKEFILLHGFWNFFLFLINKYNPNGKK